MEQRLTFVTLGVEDLTKMKTFYTKVFGWKTMQDSDGIVFFKLHGMVLSLYSADALAEDIGVTNDGSGFKRFTLSINFASEKEVDAAFSTLKANGAQVIKEPQKVFWGGYSGYIADPEDNYWELAYNPFLPLSAEGNVS